jgi:hypothetical protein
MRDNSLVPFTRSNQAIEFAPEYSRARSALSRTYNYDRRYSWSETPEDSHLADISEGY